ncbi:MAG: DUF488 domain-containing protein [Bacteroidales bacterium]|nr:DUF488 domain-containing protein [Bacteroidales bacterium]
MLYRKKILLALTEILGGEINATDFQKLLFLFSENQEERKYDFLPYKFGCFSFQAIADKNNLIKEGYLENCKNWTLKIRDESFINTLSETDRKQLSILKVKFSQYSTHDLIRYVYLNYPYFAINSEIASEHLTDKEMDIIQKFKPKGESNFLFTIGYEGKSLETYINILIRNNIKVLCDVRKNPISRKYGFSKKTLQNACEAVNIKYFHLPELGIVSGKRKNLNTQEDYNLLFKEYEENVIPEQKKSLSVIEDLVKEYKRVSLTCYEASPEQCHRTRVANKIHNLNNYVPLKHL